MSQESQNSGVSVFQKYTVISTEFLLRVRLGRIAYKYCHS